MTYSLLIDPVSALMKEVASYIEDARTSFSDESVREKSINSLVSYVDETAEKMLVEGLRKILPEAGFLTEEGTAGRKNEKLVWIIDPLDGTTNFVQGIPFVGINVALMEKDEVVAGWIADVFHHSIYHAIKGEGAFKNGHPIQMKIKKTLKDTLMATGFPHVDFTHLDWYLRVMEAMMRSSRGLRRMGAATLDLAYTAEGKLDGFFEFSLNPWDVSAGALLVQEAGGIVTDFSDGNDWLFGGEIAAGCPEIHRELLDLMALAKGD